MPLNDPAPVACSAQGCASAASIIHMGAPLCGKHALEQCRPGETLIPAMAAPGKSGRSKLSIKT